MAIICTQDDSHFKEYENMISKREVIFNIKTIFKDHWNNFLMIKCKTLELDFGVFKCPECGKKNLFSYL